MPVDKIIDDFKNRKENLDPSFIEYYSNYSKTFVQRYPRYAIKGLKGKNWKTKNKCLSDPPVLANLYGKYYTGILAQWYPQFAVIDIDARSKEFVDDLRNSMCQDESNSMLFNSESPCCYHLLFKTSFNDKPPTIRLLHSTLYAFSKQHNVELYPQINRFFRLPFSPYQDSCDPAYYNLKTWQEKLYWFEKLDPFDLSVIPGQQLPLDLQYENTGRILNTMREGLELYEHGLQCSASRNDSQFKVLYSLWRNNIPQNQAEYMTWKWINKKHNGFSTEIKYDPKSVKKEISRQASIIYEKYEYSNVYPDSTHNIYNGYLAKDDLHEILKICNGNIPRSKFLFHILKYSYPRRQRDFVNVHSNKLKNWSSKDTYLKYLDELKSNGILKRGSAYYEDKFSKYIKMNWHYKNSYEAILYDGRSIDTFEDCISLSYKPREFREILRCSGSSIHASYKATKRFFEHKQTALQI